MAKCEYCGAEFEPHSWNQKYCSMECQQANNNLLRQARRAKAVPKEKICAHCGVKFTGKPSQKYCSRSCKEKAHQKREQEKLKVVKVKKTCLNCGREYRTDDAGDPFCSTRCSLEYHGLVPREHNKNRSGRQLSDVVREARECNLDYGTYRAYLNMGKTFEEVKLLAPIRNPQVHQRTPRRER